MAALRRRKDAAETRANGDGGPSDDDISDEAMFPFGQSLFPAIAARDPAPWLLKAALLSLCVASLVAMPFAAPLAARFGVAAPWDAAHGVSWDKPLDATAALLEHAVGLTPDGIWLVGAATAACFAVLFLLDGAGVCRGPLVRWPGSWDVDNRQCYHEMFAEPTRPGALVRRPGNVYSNWPYLYAGLAVLGGAATTLSSSSAPSPTFWLPDCMFAVILLGLAALSVIWHSSNAPTSQYIDLWTMESAIAYLIVRFVALGACSLLGPDWATASALGCAAIYGLAIYANGRQQYRAYQAGFLHGGCPYSGRARLRQGDMNVAGVCAFAGMPVGYMLLPVAVQCLAIGSVGSATAFSLAAASLVVGWSVRMFERFCLDGWAPMQAVRAAQQAAAARFCCRSATTSRPTTPRARRRSACTWGRTPSCAGRSTARRRRTWRRERPRRRRGGRRRPRRCCEATFYKAKPVIIRTTAIFPTSLTRRRRSPSSPSLS